MSTFFFILGSILLLPIGLVLLALFFGIIYDAFDTFISSVDTPGLWLFVIVYGSIAGAISIGLGFLFL